MSTNTNSPDMDNSTSSEDQTLEDRTKLKKPSLYKVVMMNDDYTPMDFVIEVLIKFFNIDPLTAEQIMLTIHNKGSAVCGIYYKDIAETKAMEVNRFARDASFPLLCEIEKE